MLKTAPTETIEQAHVEAFAKLTLEQRSMVLQWSADMSDAEVAARAAAKERGRLRRHSTRRKQFWHMTSDTSAVAGSDAGDFDVGDFGEI